jgi:dipeptidyl-peptidase-4
MKKTIFLFIGLFLSISIFAQNKQLTIEEAVLGYHLYPERINGLKWRNEQTYTYVEKWSQIVQENIKTKEKTTIVKLEELNRAMQSNGIREMRYIADYEWYSKNAISFFNDVYHVVYNVETKKIEFDNTTDDRAKNLHFCKANKSVAYTVENNLYMADENDASFVTLDKDKGIVNGDAYVHRQEFGIDKGVFWSPKGNYLAFYRKDETMVADYPIVNITTRIATEEKIKYPMAGETSEQVTLGIYNVNEAENVFMKTKHDDHYLTRITWDPSENFVYIAELNRGQNHMSLNKYDVKTGKFITTLFEEKHPKYVEPEHDMIFMKTKPNQFLWFSERDGYNHLYLFNTSGKLLKQVTKGEWVVTEFLGFDAKEKNIFIQATKESPIERHIYKVNLKSGKMLRLTSEKGTHNAIFNNSHSYFVDSYTSTTVPRQINIVDASGKTVKNILTASNPLKDYKLGEMNIGNIKAADGKTDLYYRIIKPVDFDPNKKYPVVVYVYGGPHAQLVNNRWLGGAGLWDYYMAQKGYIMFTLDNRGSANRGLEFENIIHRHCGQIEMADQMKGVEYLKNLPYVDQEKIGVDGWSYGGFMTTSLMVNHPETFKVGCAGGPVIDWKFYEVMYGERYMDTPQENPEGYKQTSLLNQAENLKGRLLIIHGTVDPVVVWQNSLSFIEECVKKGVQLDYFVYPGHEHNVRGKDRVHLMQKITRYFDDFLK